MTLTIFIIGSYIKGVIKWENMVAIDGSASWLLHFFPTASFDTCQWLSVAILDNYCDYDI